jgi:hypothetical protein
MTMTNTSYNSESPDKLATRQLWGTAVATVLALYCAALVQAAQPARDGASVLLAEQQRYAAMIGRDIPALNKLLADEAVYVHTTGWKQTKAEHLGHIESGTAVYRKIDVLESKQTVIGDVGIVEGTSQFTAGPDPAKPTSYQLSFITVFVWRDQRWQMLSFHCARIPAEGANPPAGLPGGAPPAAAPRAGGPPGI